MRLTFFYGSKNLTLQEVPENSVFLNASRVANTEVSERAITEQVLHSQQK